jgi:beta-alanine degradation protein BauB
MSDHDAGSQPIGDKLILENEYVRVWEDVVAPGLEQAVHTHRNPYLSVMVTPAHGEIVDAEGNVMYSVEREPGEARWFSPDRIPLTHTLRNIGDEVIRVVVIEILDWETGK